MLKIHYEAPLAVRSFRFVARMRALGHRSLQEESLPCKDSQDNALPGGPHEISVILLIKNRAGRLQRVYTSSAAGEKKRRVRSCGMIALTHLHVHEFATTKNN